MGQASAWARGTLTNQHGSQRRVLAKGLGAVDSVASCPGHEADHSIEKIDYQNENNLFERWITRGKNVSINTPPEIIMALIRRNWFVIQKTASYYLVHITVAALVAYAVTGDLLAAVTLSLLEPTIQAVVFFFHEKAWQRADRGRCAEPGIAPNLA